MRSLSLYHALWNNLIEEKRRWFCWLPLFVGVGVIIAVCQEKAPYCLAAIISVTCLFIIKRLYLESFVILAATIAGFLAAEMRNHLAFEVNDSLSLSCKVRINSIDHSSNSTAITAVIEELPDDEDAPAALLHSKIKITAKGRIRDLMVKDDRLLPQSLAKVNAMLFPLRQPQYYGDFDSRQIAVLRGISANGVLFLPPKVISYSASRPTALIYKIRSAINAYFKRHLDHDQYTIACALITGDPLVNQNIRNSFANAGMVHILAISGLHMCIFGGVIFTVFRWIFAMIPVVALRYNTKKIAAVISLIAATAYLFISGNKIPATRALVAYLIVIFGVLADRKPLSMRSLAIAAALIVLFAPESIFLPGFQMSFAATATLIATYEAKFIKNFFNRTREKQTSKLGIYILSTVCSTTAASLSVIPFTVNSFNMLTLNSIPSNVLAIPLVGFVIIPGLTFVLAFCWWPAAANVGFYVVNWSLAQLANIANFVSDLPGSQIICPTPTKATLSIFTLSFLWLIIWQRKWRIVGLLGIILSLGLYAMSPKLCLFINSDGRAFAIRSGDTIVVNTKMRARNTIKHWALSVGCNKIEKQIRDYFLLNAGKLLLIPHDSDISDDTLSSMLPKVELLIDLRPHPNVLAERKITTQLLRESGSLGVYEKPLRAIDAAGHNVSLD
ncbi:MAG: ComEC/Rec2 family competence protein [Holosporales bacterium]|nr:ComEC/Rec2 family competence protein [Holosporales bacterium]